MGEAEAYVVRTEKASAIHARPDCPGLSRTDGAEATTYDADPERSLCPSCHDDRRFIASTPAVPAVVSCPCGDGVAEHVTAVSTPTGTRPRLEHYYRHEGCPVGGTIVEYRGRRVREAGPLFHPDRYDYLFE